MKGLKNRTLIVSYGVGRDSTAMLVGMAARGIRPDVILFADVGSEKPETYAFIPVMKRWLKSVGFPELTIVKYVPRDAPYRSIEGNMVQNSTLPGATFNMMNCTHKWKVAPMLAWTKTCPIAQKTWARGEKIVKLIGFESNEERRLKRADSRAHMGKGDSKEQGLYDFAYPLMEWGWDLERCLAEIANAGLPQPVKSACFFCPNQKEWEVTELLSPELRARIIRMELRAEPYLKEFYGLWRKPRKGDGRPGSITEFILQQGLSFMPLDRLEKRDPMPLNPNCPKYIDGYMDPPEDNLRDALREAGHDVPCAIACEGCPEFWPIYAGPKKGSIFDKRVMDEDEEDEAHGRIIDDL